jgi:hypothetical protein
VGRVWWGHEQQCVGTSLDCEVSVPTVSADNPRLYPRQSKLLPMAAPVFQVGGKGGRHARGYGREKGICLTKATPSPSVPLDLVTKTEPETSTLVGTPGSAMSLPRAWKNSCSPGEVPTDPYTMAMDTVRSRGNDPREA